MLIGLILIGAACIMLLVSYEYRLQKIEAEIIALRKWRNCVEQSFNDVTRGIRNLTDTGAMHNDIIGSMALEVADLTKFIEIFRELRSKSEVIQ